jgi:hypothetical protein
MIVRPEGVETQIPAVGILTYKQDLSKDIPI